MADTLTEGQKLEAGQSITSNNGAYSLTLQQDGNLVLSEYDTVVWATGTNGTSPERAEVQSDGNFVLYADGKPVWHSDTEGKDNVRLVLQDDRNLVLYSGDTPAWATATTSDTPPVPPAAEEAPAEEPAATAPAAAEPEAPAAPEPRTYTVVSGDTLWAIAERFYGDGNQYQKIADASGVANPDLIQPGQVLTIPE
ncbi:LysM peptidoglycan-binding domain-containing protein [Mycobacteroides salmoniphilum]|uniref:LysM domain/BON superfamily protein n=1 Tax=Mycobacteroides salmoniphilum TaxID=404941 RepID=A0A4R8SNF5_9MYCO|nr:LysM peptidoglycan-binding domain-containing protein [Mycobacteroides salmoniphilum]TDZ90514.1 LysM domain/BON superfamily protein [Mycobacteroides salmoniphilum]TEA00463.1 LysM domain/BON superfamily protein [Mycobacteroides salmoniphilum]